MHKTRIYIKT